MRLNFCYPKIIRFFHPRSHPKIIWDILKNVEITSASVLMTFMNNNNENDVEKENRSQRYDINRPRPRYGHKYTTVSV